MSEGNESEARPRGESADRDVSEREEASESLPVSSDGASESAPESDGASEPAPEPDGASESAPEPDGDERVSSTEADREGTESASETDSRGAGEDEIPNPFTTLDGDASAGDVPTGDDAESLDGEVGSGAGGGDAPEGFEPSVADLAHVDEAAASVLEDAGVGVGDVVERRVDYRTLVDAGVDLEVASKVRREYSLQWSFGTDGEDLTERSAEIRGLGDAEREWIAASAGDWEGGLAAASRARSPDGDGGGEDARPWTPPDPVTAIPGVDDTYAERLADAGIVSVRTLAIADPVKVATLLDIESNRVTSWHWKARERTGSLELL